VAVAGSGPTVAERVSSSAAWGKMVIVHDLPVSWETIFDISPVPMSLIDALGRQAAANAAYAEFLGYDHAELPGLDVGQITLPDDQVWTRRYLMRMVSGELDRFETDKVYVRKDGSHVLAHLSARPLCDTTGRCTHVLASITPLPDDLRADATEPGVAERLLDFGWEMITLVGADGRVRTTRGMHSPTHGYPTTYWRERNIEDLFAPGEWDRLIDVRKEVIAAPGGQVEVDVELQSADGEARTMAARVFNCLDDPVLQGIVIVTRDMTDERAATAELTRRRRTAEAVVDAQTRLLATVSHELRNPLHVVHGIAELLLAEELGPRAAELAASLVRQLAGLTHVTQDLLDAARLDAGKVEIVRAPTDLASLVRDVVELGQAAAGTKPVAVASRIAHGVPEWVLADADRLRQVLGNLVGNAVKFTERGSVQLVVRADGHGSLAFSVVDTGVGIPDDEQRAILQPFTVGSTAGDQPGRRSRSVDRTTSGRRHGRPRSR
jgi:PAS domain S-box-containing protein